MTEDRADKLRQPVFVVGHPRSGTTLVAASLGRHPQFAATPETHFLNEVRYALAPVLSAGPELAARRIATTRMRHFGLSEAEITAALRGAPPAPQPVFDALLRAWLRRTGKRRVVEKTPVHIRHIDEIMAWWPDVKVVWVLRDARACVSSLLRVPWAASDARVLARQWNRNVAFGLAAEKRYGDRLLRLRYEGLVNDPVAEMERLLGWLGEAFAPETLDSSIGTDVVSAPETWKENIHKPIWPGRSEAWRDQLSPAQVAAIERVCGAMLARTGYPVGTGAAGTERLRDAVANGSLGRAAQKWVYDRVAARRYAPWGASQADKGRR